MDPAALSFPALAGARARIAQSVSEVSAGDRASALLDVNPNLGELIERNTRLHSAPALRAADLYTGVLYDALDLGSLDAAARRRANRWVLVFSPLYGVLRLTDRVAPYRVGSCARTPDLKPLHTQWKPELAAALPEAAGRGLVVDCRSGSFTPMWTPTGALADRWVVVKVPGASHMAKHTRGLVTRALCVAGADPRRPEALVDILREASPGAGGPFTVALDPPVRAGRPWTLSVTLA